MKYKKLFMVCVITFFLFMNHTLALSQEDTDPSITSSSDNQTDEQVIIKETNVDSVMSDSIDTQEIESKPTDGLIFIDGHYYYLENGSLYRGFKQINGKTYFFSRIDGKMRTGMFDIDGYTYYFNSNGEMQTGLQQINGNYYYFESDGKIYRGFKILEDKTYFFSRIDGHMKLGFQVIDDELYYLDFNQGSIDGLVNASDGTYYLENGSLYRGFKQINGKTYFFSRIDGKMRTGMFDIDGYTYYFNLNGEMQTDLQQINGNYYYFESDGRLYRGFKQINGKTYFFSRIDGKMRTGMFDIDGYTYYFNLNGEMQIGHYIIGDYYYCFDTDGKMIRGFHTINNKKFFFSRVDGHMKLGWQFIDGEKYYFDINYGMATGWVTIGGLEYYFNEDGTLKLGFYQKDGYTYYVDDNGIMATDWTIIEGRKFFFNSLGQMIAKDAKMVIDVSVHQGQIDWETVKNYGMVDGVILRVGFGSINEDERLAYNISELKRLGIPYGVYLFSYAENGIEAIAEANATTDLIKKYNMNPTLGIYYDIEDWTAGSANSYGITQETYQIIVENFISTMKAYGYNSYVYTGLNFALNRFNEETRKYIRWIAQYNHVCTYPGEYDMWQYSSTERIPGINTNVDVNVLFN